ncbi:hypothetical protein NEOLI_003144 [Neolecta irregularis DAH-3]|uniref:Uncharacterized protein n=1 Tax=Neolecta irregularis (strain DAH-3) TaxID=1198029 RepID=A0A1U7LQW2_NEOID|nr:hypothetical protein NEOLI_003144 [Neolecta irregularis DAH-3]|eukprot:OLL24942.1 hypothetical protein NEOLI_003144 [Neolecta irregularis DAH-3]
MPAKIISSPTRKEHIKTLKRLYLRHRKLLAHLSKLEHQSNAAKDEIEKRTRVMKDCTGYLSAISDKQWKSDEEGRRSCIEEKIRDASASIERLEIIVKGI